MFDQESADNLIPLFHGHMERRSALPIDAIEVGAMDDVAFDLVQVACMDGSIQVDGGGLGSGATNEVERSEKEQRQQPNSDRGKESRHRLEYRLRIS